MSVQGVKSFWSGSQYDGEMLKGKRHGRGTKKWPNGDIYEGIAHAWRIHESCWVRARAHSAHPGSGVRRTGEWRFDKKDGHGRMTDVAAGASYEGEWRGGSKHGKGIVTFAKEDVYEGEWDCDRYVLCRCARASFCVRACVRERTCPQCS